MDNFDINIRKTKQKQSKDSIEKGKRDKVINMGDITRKIVDDTPFPRRGCCHGYTCRRRRRSLKPLPFLPAQAAWPLSLIDFPFCVDDVKSSARGTACADQPTFLYVYTPFVYV